MRKAYTPGLSGTRDLSAGENEHLRQLSLRGFVNFFQAAGHNKILCECALASFTSSMKSTSCFFLDGIASTRASYNVTQFSIYLCAPSDVSYTVSSGPLYSRSLEKRLFRKCVDNRFDFMSS